MGSGTNRKFWADKGSRTARRKGTKTRDPRQAKFRLTMKANRAEAKTRSSK